MAESKPDTAKTVTISWSGFEPLYHYVRFAQDNANGPKRWHALLRREGLTDEALGRRFGRSASTFRAWRLGEAQPPIDKALEVGRLFLDLADKAPLNRPDLEPRWIYDPAPDPSASAAADARRRKSTEARRIARSLEADRKEANGGRRL